MIPLPVDNDNGQQEIFKSCCGNFICNGCWYVMTCKAQDEGKSFEETLCAYCRTREYRGDKEFIERLEDHMERGNADAHMALGSIYCDGIHGLPQDMAKANELFLKAGELGCSGGYFNLGKAYEVGRGVDINKKKARHFYELAAIMGNVLARCMLAGYESESGNVPLAFKHFSISARAGHTVSMDTLRHMKRVGGLIGRVTNEEYEETLRSYNQRQDESKSEERDKAALVMEELLRRGVVGGVGPGYRA
jgi:TPR repeat protein